MPILIPAPAVSTLPPGVSTDAALDARVEVLEANSASTQEAAEEAGETLNELRRHLEHITGETLDPRDSDPQAILAAVRAITGLTFP